MGGGIGGQDRERPPGTPAHFFVPSGPCRDGRGGRLHPPRRTLCDPLCLNPSSCSLPPVWLSAARPGPPSGAADAPVTEDAAPARPGQHRPGCQARRRLLPLRQRAPGSRTTPSPPTRYAGAVSTRSTTATRMCSMPSLRIAPPLRPRGPRTPRRAPTARRSGISTASGMDEKAIDADGVKPLAPYFDKIAALKDAAGLPALLADLHRTSVNALFEFRVDADEKNSGTDIAQVYQGGPRDARPRLLPTRRQPFQDSPRGLRVARHEDVHPPG